MTEDKMIGWHHRLNGHEFEQTLGMVKGRVAWRVAVHAQERLPLPGLADSWRAQTVCLQALL